MPDLPQPEDDGLYITEDVGEWSRDKHYYLVPVAEKKFWKVV